MTPFSFEHTFRAPSVDAVFAAYFDDALTLEQDRAVDIVERELVEETDDGCELRRVTRVVPRRQLPVIVKPFVAGPLHYIETVTWRRAANELEIIIRPSLLKGRVQITGTYKLEQVGPDEIRRTYAGDVSVDIALLASRVERAIVEEFARSMPLTAARTQEWLNHYSARSLSARA